MIVYHNDGGSGELKGAFGDFSWVERRVIDRAALLDLVFDQDVLLVQKKNPELFDWLMAKGELEIVQKSLPGGDHRPLLHIFGKDALEQPLDRLDMGDGKLTILVDPILMRWDQPRPSLASKRAGSAARTPPSEPNSESKCLASGFTSIYRMLKKSSNSSNS